MRKQHIKLQYELFLTSEPDTDNSNLLIPLNNRTELRESRHREKIVNLKKIKIFSGVQEDELVILLERLFFFFNFKKLNK